MGYNCCFELRAREHFLATFDQKDAIEGVFFGGYDGN